MMKTRVKARAKMRVKTRVNETKTFSHSIHIMSDNKLVKFILDAATITGLVAGVG